MRRRTPAHNDHALLALSPFGIRRNGDAEMPEEVIPNSSAVFQSARQSEAAEESASGFIVQQRGTKLQDCGNSIVGEARAQSNEILNALRSDPELEQFLNQFLSQAEELSIEPASRYSSCVSALNPYLRLKFYSPFFRCHV